MDYENEIKIIKEQIVTLQEKIDNIVYNLQEQQSYKKVELPFKVGDQVQFKTWEEMKNEKGYSNYSKTMVINYPVVFTREMDYLCGTYATIKEIDGEKVELCDFTANYCTDWCYSLDMLKHAENEPKWVFTDDEKTILRNISNDYEYITRDSDGDLELHTEEPYKDSGIWYCQGDTECFDIYNDIFKCIKWEDEEPCEFRKYI